MKKLAALFLALLLLLSLAACGSAEEPAAEAGGGEAPTRAGIPETEPVESGEESPTLLDPADLDWDLSICQPEEAFHEIEHYNTDPSGYVGLRLRVTGEVSRFESHDRTFYYVGVRDADGCIENLELRFPGDGSEPAGFPADGSMVTVWGRMGAYSTRRDGKDVLCAVLTDVQFTLQTDFRD